MNYEDAVQYLFRLIRYGTKLGLDNMHELLEKIGEPHKSLRVVHIAGSKGKGSVAAFLSSILKEAGYRVGTFTSPHLIDFTERIRVDWECIPKDDVARITTTLKEFADEMSEKWIVRSPTFFEMSTAMAFKYFEERNVDFAIVEAGMGGRYDATNVVDPVLAIITHICMEHAEHLGRSLSRITRDKAGIIKEGVPVVSASDSSIIRQFCRKEGCRLAIVGKEVEFERVSYDLSGQDFLVRDGGEHRYHIDLLGNYQIENACVAYLAVMMLRDAGYRISDVSIEKGFGKARWPGRMQLLQNEPLIIVDTTHEAGGCVKLVESLDELIDFNKSILIFGALEDKDVSQMASILSSFFDKIITTEAEYRKALPVEDVKKAFQKFCKRVDSQPTVPMAIQKALKDAERNDLLCITGSTFVAGEAFDYFGKSPED